MTSVASNSSANRSGLIAPLLEQAIFGLFAALVLDGGRVAQAVVYLSIAFWIGAITIWVRREKLSFTDKLYLRFGLPVILIAGVPLFHWVWSMKGVV